MKACFIGLGYIGLPTAIIAAKSGVEVVGVDINAEIVEQTNQGKLHFIEPGLELVLRDVIEKGSLVASTVPQKSDVFVIVVPTPFNKEHAPDTSFVQNAINEIAPFLEEGNLVIIESTCPVGTTDSMAELLFSVRLELSDKIYIAYCPERVLPGNVVYELLHNDRVVGGYNKESAHSAVKFYKKFVKGDIFETTTRTAELCKLTENSSRDVQIAFANELSLICDKCGVDVWELISLANKHPRVNILNPGCGVGGHCIAVDPYFITWDFPDESKLIATARRTNKYKADWCVEKIRSTILEFELKNHRKPVVALMGLSFKPNIDDLRESPALYIATSIDDSFADYDIRLVEPYLSEFRSRQLFDYKDAYKSADIVAFLTNHKVFSCFRDSLQDNKNILDFCGTLKKF